MLLAFMLSLQSYAQKYAERQGEPVDAIEVGVDYLLADPWEANEHHLCGTTAVYGYPPLDAIYNFEDTGAKDKDGNILYRLKQKTTGMYLEDPALSKKAVRMTEQAARAFVFTAKLGKPTDSKENLDGDDDTPETWTEAWLNGDIREIYEPMDKTFENVFVFCNKDLNAETKVFEIFGNGYNAMWNQYTNARIWHLYQAVPATAYDNLCYYFNDNFPEEGVDNLFIVGNAPGNIPESTFNAFLAAYNNAKKLVNGDEQQTATVYEEAIANLAKAFQACKDSFIDITPGFYVIDNNPAAGRAEYAKTKNACLTDINGGMYWRGFDKPDTMDLEGAAFIWEVKAAEGKDGGFYLRNYGTNHYAGSLKNNYKVVPSTEAPIQVYDINYRGGEYFSLDQRGQNSKYPALHADKNTDMKIVIWTSVAPASQWKFIPVDESELQGIEKQLEQQRLNTELNRLYNKTVNAWNKGFIYSGEGCTRDGNFSMDHCLVTEAGQLLSNAPESPEKEPGNDYANLLDGNFETYFHTIYSDAAYAKHFHYLDVALNEAVKTFNIKYAQRHNVSDGSPVKVHVYASNDTTGGQWADQGYMTCEYNLNVEYANANGETFNKSNFAGIASKVMNDAYKYIRLEVEGTKRNSKTNGNLFWYWSEFRIYKAAYDKNNSLIEAVPTEVKEALLAEMDKAKAAIDAKKATTETIESLQAAFDKFMESYPDPDIINNLISEAEGQANNAFVEEEEGQLGYFKAGAPEALKAVIEEVKATLKPLMTMEEINAAKAKINAALAEFNKMLNVPADGMYCLIQSATSSTQEGTAMDQFLNATNNGGGQVKYGQPEAMNDRINYLWKITKHEDGSYSFQNVGTGDYLGNPKKNDVRVNMSFEADSLNMRSAKAAGLFNFVCTDNVFYNAQPNSGNLVTWGNASGTDNSAFRIMAMEEAGDVWDGNSIHIDFNNKFAKIASYPYELIGEAYNCALYKVLGLNKGQLVLQKYSAEEVIPAATPFVVVPNETDENGEAVVAGNLFMPDVFDPLVGMTYTFENGTQGGMTATIRGAENVRGGIFFEGNVISAVEGDNCAPNSGLFNEKPNATEVAEGEGIIKVGFPAELQTGIEDIVIVPNNSGVYSISGVKVRNNGNLNNLPKGVYIVNGQKVLVK